MVCGGESIIETVLLILALGIVVLIVVFLFSGAVMAILISKVTFNLYVNLHKLEAQFVGVWGPLTLKGYALREGRSEELSLDFSLAGRLFVVRLDIPVVSYGRKDGKPALKVLRQFEVGSRKASPISEGSKAFNVKDLMLYAPLVHKMASLTWVHAKILISKSTLRDISLQGCFGFNDSAQTAIVYGVVMGFFETGLAALTRRAQVKGVPLISLNPVFNREVLAVHGSGEVKVKGLHLISFAYKSGVAVLPVLMRLIRKRRKPKITTDMEHIDGQVPVA